MKDDLVRRKDVLALTHELNFKNVPGLEHYKHRCIDPDAVREMEGVEGTGVGQRVEESNKTLSELENTLADHVNNTTNIEAAIAMILKAQCSVNTEIAKSLAQLADDINCLREKIAKWLEEDEAPAHTCKDCVHYRRKMTDAYNYIFHWCDYQDCAIKECRLNHPCIDFEEAKEEEYTS